MAKLYTTANPYRVIAGIGAGAGAALVMIVVMAALRFLVRFPTIPELMLNTIITLMGGEAFSAAIDTFYYAGRPLLFAAILEGTLLLGVVLGLLYARAARPGPLTARRHPLFNSRAAGVLYGLLIGVLLNSLFLPLIGQEAFATKPLGLVGASIVPIWLGLMFLALIYGVVLQSLLPAVPLPVPLASSEPASEAAAALVLTSYDAPVDRRYFLRFAGGTLLAAFGGALVAAYGTYVNQGNSFTSPVTNTAADAAGAANDVAQVGSAEMPTVAPPAATNTPRPEPTATPEPQVAVAEPPTGTPQTAQEPPTSTPEPVPTDTPFPTDTPAPTDTATAVPTPLPAIKVREITPTESFYHVSKNFFDPSPGSDGWKLDIKGLVARPYSLDYKTLTSMPATTVTTGMMCISNPVGGGLAGNTTWKGVRMADLIKKAAPKAGVVDVVMRAVDDYADSIPYQKALDPNVMLVWEMGGKPLTSQHGFPARLLVPGIYGMKHVKWITSIELVNYDFKGFWQQPDQGWSDPALVNTMSRIDFPSAGTLTTAPQGLSGIAFAGDRSISKVEVSTDGGNSWSEVYLKPPRSRTSWVVWGYTWMPPAPGKYTVMVRATDGKGNLQSARRTDPYPNGATGYHTVTYTVKPASGSDPSPQEAQSPATPVSPSRFFLRDPTAPKSR